MPGVISRDGTVMVMPEFSQAQREDMAQSIARAMVSLSHETIEKSVHAYLAEQEEQ